MTEQIPPIKPPKIPEQSTPLDRISAVLRMLGQKDYDDLYLGIGIEEIAQLDEVLQTGVRAARNFVTSHFPRP